MPSGRTTLVAVKKMRTARGTTMMAMARNWRRRKASAPSWMAAAISRILGVPCVGGQDPPIRIRPTTMPKSGGGQGETSQTFSVPVRTKLW